MDATETLDTAAYNEFNSTLLTVVGATSSTLNTIDVSGTPAQTNNIELRAAHVKLISDQMKERNIPGYFDSGDYGCIARPSTFRPFKNDLESLHQYVVPGFTLIMNGEIGRYEGIRLVH